MALQPYSIALGNKKDDSAGNNYAANQAVYILKADRTLQSIYSDAAGLNEITQDGISNVSNADGEFSFYIEVGQYIANVGVAERPFTIFGTLQFDFDAITSDPLVFENLTSNVIDLPYEIALAQVQVNGQLLPPNLGFYEIDNNLLTLTLNTEVNESTIVTVRAAALTTEASNYFLTPYEYGAVGNGIADDTDALESYFSDGGQRLGAAGVFRITRPIVIDGGVININWPTCGAGTGGFNPNAQTSDYLTQLQLEAAAGAGIIYVDPTDWTNPNNETAALVFRDPLQRSMASVTIQNFKITSHINNPAPIGLIRIDGAYDNNSMFNVNALFCGDSYHAIEVAKNVKEGSLGQSVNWTGVNAIGSTGGNRTASTIKIDWLQEGTFNSCKAFGSPYRVDENNNNAPLYSANDCWEIDNSRGLVWVGCSGALTLGSGFVFRATERKCIDNAMIGCTHELIGFPGQVTHTAIKLVATTNNTVGNLTILAPRNEAPVNYFLRTVSTDLGGGTVYAPIGVKGNLGNGDAVLDVGTSNCTLEVLTLDKVTDISGNNTNSYWSPANGITGYDIHAKTQAVKKDIPSFRLETSLADMGDFWEVKWNATSSTDTGVEYRNSRAGKYLYHGTAGELVVNNGVDFDNTTSRVSIHPEQGMRTIFPSDPLDRLVAGDSEEYVYKRTFRASTSGGIVDCRYEFDGGAVMTHQNDGSLLLDGAGQTSIKLKEGASTTSSITIVGGELYINGVQKTGL